MLFDRRGRRKYLTPDERRRFIEVSCLQSSEIRAFCLTIAMTGCRLSEALELTWAQVDQIANEIVLRSLKKRRHDVYRPVPVPPFVLTSILDASPHREKSSHERIWPWCRATGWKRVKEVLHQACVAGGHASPKGLRHGFAAAAVLSGVPLSVVQRWLGHSNIATTAIYTGIVGEEERELAARLWRTTPSIDL